MKLLLLTFVCASCSLAACGGKAGSGDQRAGSPSTIDGDGGSVPLASDGGGIVAGDVGGTADTGTQVAASDASLSAGDGSGAGGGDPGSDLGTPVNCAPMPLFTDSPSPTRAREADQFVESIGVAYKTVHAPWAKERLGELGARHVRADSHEVSAQRASYRGLYDDLGVRVVIATSKVALRGGATGKSVLDAVLAIGPRAVFAVEGVNEPNCCPPKTTPVSAEQTRAFQLDVFRALRGHAETKRIPILSWSVYGASHNSLSWYKAVGDIGDYMDASNMHTYPQNNPPETFPLVLGRVKNVVANFGAADKPILMTEFCHSRGSLTDQAVLTPRFYLHLFDHGVMKAYNYTFVDIPSSSCAFLRSDGTPKPVFHAVKNLIALLEDEGPRFLPGALAYTLSGNTSGIERVLLQKRNGTYYLALWVGGALKTSPRTLSLSLPVAMSSIAVARPNEGLAWNEVGSGSSAAILCDERVTIVRLVPALRPSLRACEVRAPGW